MPWRNWSVIVTLILAHYLIFSMIGTWVFPVPPRTIPTHTPQPTFTPGEPPLQRVEPLGYDFLTPSATPTVTGTPPTETPTPTVTRTPRVTLSPTRAP